jgi:hypothetical protein
MKYDPSPDKLIKGGQGQFTYSGIDINRLDSIFVASIGASGFVPSLERTTACR